MRFASWSVTLLGGFCGMFLLSCTESNAPAPQKDSAPARPVRIAHAEMRPMERAIAATGTLAAQESATISTKISGRIQRLEVDLGSVVRRGDLIAQVEPRDYELRLQQSAAILAEARAALGLPLEGDQEKVEPQAVNAVKQAKAVLDEATRSLERFRSLTTSRIISEAELDAADAAHKVALTRYDAALDDARARIATLAQRRAEYEIAQKQLSDTSVLAPFDGAVQVRRASIGEYVATGTPIAVLVKADPLRLRLEVPERESMLVRIGQSVRLAVDGDTNVYSGRIARLSPALDEINRMLLVEADVPNPGALRAGLFARATIVVNESEEGLSVPASALITFAGIEKVVTIYDGKALEKTVTTGRHGPGWIEIRSGIVAGTPVILDPGGIRSGQSVAVAKSTDCTRTSPGSNARTVEG